MRLLENRLIHAFLKGVSGLTYSCRVIFTLMKIGAVKTIFAEGRNDFFPVFYTERIDKGTETKSFVLCKMNALFTQNL